MRIQEPSKIVKSEKGIDHREETKGDQPGPSGEGVIYTIHRMVHTVAGGAKDDPVGAGAEERERYTWMRGHAISPNSALGK